MMCYTITDCIKITVKDTGIGIDAEKLQKIRKIISDVEEDNNFGKD